MGWTGVKTWAIGDIVLASEMNTYNRDNLDYLQNTAFKKVLPYSATWTGPFTFQGGEKLAQLVLIQDPEFPSTQYRYVAWGTFTVNPARSTGTSLSSLTGRIRDNTITGTEIARSWDRVFSTDGYRGYVQNVSSPVTVAALSSQLTYPKALARYVNYTFSADFQDTFDVNYNGEKTWQGAMVTPV